MATRGLVGVGYIGVMAEASGLRVSDEQRERAAAEIREHFAAGRLDADELSERLEAIYRARNENEVQALRADLPVLPVSAAQRQTELATRRAGCDVSSCNRLAELSSRLSSAR